MDATNYIKTKFNKPFIYQRADPYIYCHNNGKYYFTASVPSYDCIVLREGDTIDALAQADERVIWRKHEKGIMSEHIWAPEIHFIDNEWFVYFAAGEKDDVWRIRPYILKCSGMDPMCGNWIEMGLMHAADNFSFQDFSLDMTVFQNKNKYYCVWAEKVNVGKKISNLYIAEMKNPTELSTAQVLLSSPDYTWERTGFWVNEGPALLHHNHKLYLTYSASETGSCYCMGMLSISEDDDLLDPRAWKKEKYPVLKSDCSKGLYGPGHNSFVKSEDGKKDIMVYHARQYDDIVGDPLYDANRHTYLMEIKWDEEDRPIFEFENNIV